MPIGKERELRLKLAEAYAAQSQSDFLVYNELLIDAAQCHRLHYLQMACEKIAKAYRLRDTPSALEEAMTSHVAFSKFIENLMIAAQIKAKYRAQDEKLRQISKTAREIERLAPAVDRSQ